MNDCQDVSKNLGNVSDEHGERFHLNTEQNYKEYWDQVMLGDYSWSLVRDTDIKNTRKKLKW